MDVIVRDLQESDREDILEISKHIWEGHDYIPQTLDTWLANGACHTLVAVSHSKAIGIANMRVVDQGKTGWMEGLRVHPEYRGEGIANTLTDEIVERAKQESIIRLRYTTASVNAASIVIAERIGMVRKFEMGIFWKETSVFESSGTPAIQSMTVDEVYGYLQDRPSLIPNNVLIFDWKAFDVNVSNLSDLEKCETLWGRVDESSLVSFSIAGTRTVSAGSMWTVTVYTKDTGALLEQLHFHSKFAEKKEYPKIVCTYPIQFQTILEDMGLVTNEEREFRLYLYEKVLVDSESP